MDIIAVLLPILCFVALLRVENFRESFLKSAAVTALFTAFCTELLSLFHAVAFLPLLACWSLYLAALLAWRYRSGKLRQEPSQGYGQFFANPSANLPQVLLVGLMACIVVITGITALVAAPNNFDSLTYHLPRVMHWIQNRSVAHYPTNIDRQLVMAPFSEYMIMHLQILSGSDRFANCVQWFAMVGSVLGVSLVARAFKASVTAQIVAAALAISVPMGLLQSTSTQNDYTVTLWLVCLAYFIVNGKERGGLRQALWVGSSLALAIFTKGTAYLIAGPFMLIYLWQLFTQASSPEGGEVGGDEPAAQGKGVAAGPLVRRAVVNLAVIGAAVLLLNGSHLLRNYQTFGNPLSHGTGNDILCKRIDLTSTISCLTRNIAVQLSPGQPAANKVLYGMTQAVHRAIGIDLNDHDTTADDDFMILPALVRAHEDYAPNPLHMLLLALTVGALVLRWRKVPKEVILFTMAAMLGFVILSMFLKWTPYLSRYFLPIYVLSAPVTALVSDAVKPRALVTLCCVLLLCASFFVLDNNFMRPLSGKQSIFSTSRTEQYFRARPQAIGYFSALANMVKGQPNRNVGIENGNGNMLEYPLWVLVNDGAVKYRIEHVDVKDLSGKIKLQDFTSYFPASI